MALITGTLHVMHCRLGTLRDTFRKGEGGRLAFEEDTAGYFAFWDSAQQATDDHGRIFLDEDGAQVPETDVELGPAKGEDVIDANMRARWRSAGEAVPDCCVCASLGPEGEGDAADLYLSTVPDAYTLCNNCRKHVEDAEQPDEELTATGDTAQRVLVAQGCNPRTIDRARLVPSRVPT